MRNLFKRYYEMSNDTKEELGRLYILDELENLLPEYENIHISTMAEEEIILEKAIACWYYSNIDGGEIVRRILDVLSGRDITIEDLKTTEIEELIELITDDKEDFKQFPDKTILISEFYYKDFKCVFFKDCSRFILTLEKNNNVNVLTFNSINEILCFVIDNREKLENYSNE